MQDPDFVMKEYPSPYLYTLTLIKSFILLSSLPDSEIATLLLEPLYNVEKYWPKRNESCIALAKLASTMSKEILHLYFSQLMQRPPCETALIAGRIFLAMVRIDVFEELLILCRQLINKLPDKLDFFMRISLPSFHRLYGNNKAACELLITIMENITPETPRTLQEAAIDAICLIYLKLSMYEYRTDIIKHSSSFAVDLRSNFASSLDIDISNSSPLFKKIKEPQPKRKNKNVTSILGR